MNLRGTYKKSYFREINKQLIVIGLIFLTAVVIGTYLNKMWPDYQGNIVNSINPIVEYYSSKISIKNIVLANLKSDISFMMYISLSTLFVVTFPITLILFIVKGISMGYLIIILGTIILILISINYIKEMVLEFKKSRNRSKMIFLFSRYILNSIIVLAITIGLQVLLNTLIISIIKFLVR